MARRVGSEDGGPKPAGRKKTSPDLANVTPESFLEAVRLMAVADAAVAQANDARKATRKRIKSMGIELGDMDSTVKMVDWERPEVRERFERRQKYAEWLGLPVGSQPDMFKGMGDDEIQAREWHAAGRTQFLAGRARLIPEEVPEEFEIHWTAGFDGKPNPAVGAQAEAPAGKGNGGKAKGPKAEPEVRKAKAKAKAKAAAGESNVVPLPKREGPADDKAPGFDDGLGETGKPH